MEMCLAGASITSGVLGGYRPNTNFENEKIISPYRATNNIFSYSNSSVYSSIDIFYTNITDTHYSTKYINAIVCSSLMAYWLNFNCKKKGNILELYQKPLSEIPIKKADETIQNKFVSVLDKILAITVYVSIIALHFTLPYIELLITV